MYKIMQLIFPLLDCITYQFSITVPHTVLVRSSRRILIIKVQRVEYPLTDKRHVTVVTFVGSICHIYCGVPDPPCLSNFVLVLPDMLRIIDHSPPI